MGTKNIQQNTFLKIPHENFPHRLPSEDGGARWNAITEPKKFTLREIEISILSFDNLIENKRVINPEIDYLDILQLKKFSKKKEEEECKHQSTILKTIQPLLPTCDSVLG